MTLTHSWGIDPGYATSPTGVALLRFEDLTPRLVGARYVVEGRLCQLGRDGVLRVVANEERRAA